MFQFYLVSIVFRFSLCPFNYGFSIWLCYMAPSLKDFPCNICLCHISTDAKTCDVCKPLCHRHSQKRTFWALTFFRSKCYTKQIFHCAKQPALSRMASTKTEHSLHTEWSKQNTLRDASVAETRCCQSSKYEMGHACVKSHARFNSVI